MPSASASSSTVEERSPETKAAQPQKAQNQCPSHRRGLAFYRFRHSTWLALRDVKMKPALRQPYGCGHTLWLAHVWKTRAFEARLAYHRWLESRYVLHDFRVTAGNQAWFRAIEEAQRAYPNTAWWLKSCSSSEGGWGRWVPNSDGYPPGGWMQMYESTFWRMWGTAWRDVTQRGFKVPRTAHSWYSPLGQALASAWGLTNGRRSEWNSSGC